MKNKKKAKPTRVPSNSTAKPSRSPGIDHWAEPIRKHAGKALIALILAGFLLRILNLDALSLWVDEYVHVSRADNYLSGAGPLFTEDNNGILYTFFLLPLFKFFGSTPFWARLPSVFFGIGMIYLTYRIATRLFNPYIALLSAFGTTFSLYLTFWSRISRNYAIFGFFFLLFFWYFLKAIESEEEGLKGLWKRFSISPRYTMLMLPALFLCLLSHQLTFFFLFSFAFYCICHALWRIVKGDPERYRNKYFFFAALSVPLVFLVFSPAGHGVVRFLLSPVLSPDQIVWALPDWGIVLEKWKSKPFEAFNVYNAVLQYDTGFLYGTGLAGIAAAWWWNRKSALWLTSLLVIPLVLLGFVYRDPSVQRYIIFVQPFFWVASAVFFGVLLKWLLPLCSRKAQLMLLAAPFLLVLLSTKWAEIGNLALARQKSGFVVSSKIGGLNFSNWKETCQYVSTHRKPGEIVLATVSNGASYYLKDEHVLPFRQANYDTKKKHQVFNPPKLNGTKCADSYEDLVYTVNNTPAGWLLADYYLETSYVDDRARQFVYQNMVYFPEASSDGDVMLFKWDNSVQKPENQNMVLDLGRTASKLSSRITNINVTDELLSAPELKMTVRAANVDSRDEAFVVFNNQFPVFLPPNQSAGIETHVIPIRKNILKRGNNTIQVGYNPQVKRDTRKGFMLYYLRLSDQ